MEARVARDGVFTILCSIALILIRLNKYELENFF
jgi:hypothetical protein